MKKETPEAYFFSTTNNRLYSLFIFSDFVFFFGCFAMIATTHFNQEREYKNNTRFWTGSCVAIVGCIFWMVARKQLGTSFSINPKAMKLVTTGLYSNFRNPIYLFSWISFLGLAIAARSWLGGIYITIAIPMQMRRAYKEKLVLQKNSGTYTQNTAKKHSFEWKKKTFPKKFEKKIKIKKKFFFAFERQDVSFFTILFI